MGKSRKRIKRYQRLDDHATSAKDPAEEISPLIGFMPCRNGSSIFCPEVMHDISDLVDLPIAYVPFRVQHFVLLALQRYLEAEAFRFVEQWLPKEAESNGWSCAEALELHKLFPFLKKNCRKLPLSAFPQKQKPPPN
ncbi:hypothetical protein N7478_010583 [Penicillium angulare]|uniref:uncharacterized protein n=1 Tax=Penicillium angulare TaxID=116970 RepID=UPI00253F7E21|nr:uncharacterized protein N7478_010583 [Penicillium angulare]KAJ5267775.1 hypothetical protein N7478_010583 [Penicillium angulare]